MQTATRLVQTSLDALTEADEQLQKMLDYPLTSTLASEEVTSVLQDDFGQVPAFPRPPCNRRVPAKCHSCGYMLNDSSKEGSFLP